MIRKTGMPAVHRILLIIIYRGTPVSIVGPVETRPADGLAVDFVVEADRAQLVEIVERVRDGRLRTNIGSAASLDDALAAFNASALMPEELVCRGV